MISEQIGTLRVLVVLHILQGSNNNRWVGGGADQMSKVQLTISPDYVDSWTYVEAVRELFQNALDNEAIAPDNKMFFSYEGGVLSIGNKSSVLTVDSLLLGSSSKRNDGRTIGSHGEGYKIALMVLLREGKCVTIYNYGANEIWRTRLVKSRKFKGSLLVEVSIERGGLIVRKGSNNLVIEVKGVTETEYESIKSSNLNLQSDVERLISDGYGSVLLNDKFKGDIFIRGLYVTHIDDLTYGYDLLPDVVHLDRDRKLVDALSMALVTSKVWYYCGDVKELSNLILTDAFDVKYVHIVSGYSAEDYRRNLELSNEIHCLFVEEHGDIAVPVRNNIELQTLSRGGDTVKPVIVSDLVSSFLSKVITAPEELTMSARDRLRSWFERIESVLSTDDRDEFEDIFYDL